MSVSKVRKHMATNISTKQQQRKSLYNLEIHLFTYELTLFHYMLFHLKIHFGLSIPFFPEQKNGKTGSFSRF